MRKDENNNDNKLFITPQDIMEITGRKYDFSCKLIRELNAELKEKGFRTAKGRVLKSYFLERYGGDNASL